MDLSSAWLGALVLVAIPVMTLGDLYELEGRVVLFASDLAKGVFGEFIVAPCARFLIASSSPSCKALLRLRM